MTRIPWGGNSVVWEALSRVKVLKNTAYVQDDLIPVEFLARLQDTDSAAPAGFDFSSLLGFIINESSHIKTWRQYSDLLMHYIGQTDPFHLQVHRVSLERFLRLCADEPGSSSSERDYRRETSRKTRQLAKSYLIRLEGDVSRTSCDQSSF